MSNTSKFTVVFEGIPAVEQSVFLDNLRAWLPEGVTMTRLVGPIGLRFFTPEGIALLRQKIDYEDFSTRTANILKSDSIIYIKDLVIRKESELLRIPNCGRLTLNEVKTYLTSKGLYLSMDLGDWDWTPPGPVPHNKRYLLNMPVSELEVDDFGSETRYIGHLIQSPPIDADLYEKLEKKLEKMGLSLTMDVGSWQPPVYDD